MSRMNIVSLVCLQLVAVSAVSKLAFNYRREGTTDFEAKPAYPDLWISCKPDTRCETYDQITAVYFPETTYNGSRMEPVFRPDYACLVNYFRIRKNGRNIYVFSTTIPPKKPFPLEGLTVINLDTAGYQMVRWETPQGIDKTCTITYILKQSKNGVQQWVRHLLQDEPILIGGLEPDTEYEYAVQVKPGWLSQPSDVVQVAKRTPVAFGLPVRAIDLSDGQPKDDRLPVKGFCRILPSGIQFTTPNMNITNALNENAQILEFEPMPSMFSDCKFGILVKTPPGNRQTLFLSDGPHVMEGLRLKESYSYDICLALANGVCATTERRFSKRLEYTQERLNPVWFQMSTSGSTVTINWEIPAFAEQYLTHFNITVRERERIPFCPIAVQKGILKYRYIFTGLVPDDQFIVILRGFEEKKLRMEVRGAANDGKYTNAVNV